MPTRLKTSLLNLLALGLTTLATPDPTQPLELPYLPPNNQPKTPPKKPTQDRRALKAYLRTLSCKGRVNYRLLERANQLSEQCGVDFATAHRWASYERQAKQANDKRSQLYSIRRG